VQIEHVFGKCFSILHICHSQRQFLEILFQIGPAFAARQHILQTQNETSVVLFVFGFGIHGVIETNGVEKMPRTIAPNGREKPVVTIVIFLGKDVFSGLGHLSLIYTRESFLIFL
jgi:hypothetical protein